MVGSQKIYDGVIDFNVENNSHTKAYHLIGSGTKKKKILEVGCAKGYFGAALKDEGHVVWGVEPSGAAAKEARKHLDFVHHGFVQDFFISNKGAKFEHITFGDVIEHLYNPEEILQQCKDFLTPDGSIICSIPNVTHIAVRTMLLEGRWEYSDMGILDDTHVRFYTRTSIAQLLAKAGYKLVAIDFVRLTAEQVNDIYHMGLDLDLLEITKGLVGDDEDEDIFQVVFKAVPSKHNYNFLESKNINVALGKGKNVLCIIPFHGSTLIDIRLRLPLEKWAAKYGGNLRVLEAQCVKEEDAKWADFSAFSRETNFMTDYCERLMRCHSVFVIFEIDDLLTEVPAFLSVHEHAMKNKETLCSMMRVSDAVTTTTERLAEKLRLYNENVWIVPNCAEPTVKADFDPRGKVSLIIASSDTIRMDFIADAIAKIVSIYKNKDVEVEIIGVGPPGEWLSSKGIRVKELANMPYVTFRDFLEKQDNAIGVIPLDYSDFSSCKSPIKYIDYSFSGIPSICSNVPPYSDYITSEMTGLLVANETDAWVNALSALIDSLEERKRIASSAWDYCNKNFTMDKSAEIWEDLFVSLTEASHEATDIPLNVSPISFGKVPLYKKLTSGFTYKMAYKELQENGIRSVMKKALRLIGRHMSI